VKHLIQKPKAKYMSFEEMPELLTIKDVTNLLNVHPNTLRNWEKEGLIQVIRIGPRKDRRYKKEVIQKMLYA
jgi:predicted site-specific integrase-resolvase